MFKRLMRWLCGPEPKSARQQLREWLQSRPRTPERVAVPTEFYNRLKQESELDYYTFWMPAMTPSSSNWMFHGVEIFPDPSVTEFMSR